MYKFLADSVFWFHWLWALLLIGGIFITSKWPKYWRVHMIIVWSTGISQVLWLGCPLTELECSLRSMHDPSYNGHGTFLAPFLSDWLGYEIHPIVITFGLVLVTLINVCIFFFSKQKATARTIS